MDLNIMDKLRLLKIDTELRTIIKMRPMSRYYFASATNPGEQFFVFASTSAWLIRKTGKDFDQPNEEDDPNAIIANIIDILREKGAAIDFSSHKLKQGYGEQVCFILNILADEVLKKKEFEWQIPEVDIQEPDETEDVDQVEDQTEIFLDKVEEDMDIYSDESDEFKEDTEEGNNDTSLTKAHDWEAWKLELERVTPALRLRIAADGRDWRTRHTQMTSLKSELEEKFKTTSTQLSKLHTNTSSALDKIAAREKILNEQFAPLIQEYGTLIDELEKVEKELKQINLSVNEKQDILNELTAKVESVKQRTESRGSSMNDNSQLVNAKKAKANMKKDIQELDFQIIVLIWLITSKENKTNINFLGNNETAVMVASEAY